MKGVGISVDIDLSEIVRRQPVAEPWVEGEKIPWHEPEFSRRMLAEHLTQSHDAASRRFDKIDSHVACINRELLKGTSTRVLDLGCGPGLYTSPGVQSTWTAISTVCWTKGQTAAAWSTVSWCPYA